MLDWATSPGAGARGAAQPGQASCVPLDPCLGSPEETRSSIPPLQSPSVCTQGSAALSRAWSIAALLAMLLCWLMQNIPTSIKLTALFVPPKQGTTSSTPRSELICVSQYRGSARLYAAPSACCRPLCCCRRKRGK